MLDFKICNGGETGRFIDGSIYFTVANGYISDNQEEHAEVREKIRRLLAGEQGLTVDYLISRCDADIPIELANSINQIARHAPGFFRIQDDWFELWGGFCGTQLGFTTYLKARYSENKKAIDSFLEYMLLDPPAYL